MKKTAVVILILMLASLLVSCGGESIEYIKGQSAVKSVTYESGNITLETLITLKNTTSEDLSFTVTGTFDELAEAGIIASRELPVADRKGFSEVITVPAKTTLCIECYFRGPGSLRTDISDTDPFLPAPDSLAFEFVSQETEE